MAGKLQILTYLLAFYLVIKGIEVLQIDIAPRVRIIVFGLLVAVSRRQVLQRCDVLGVACHVEDQRHRAALPPCYTGAGYRTLDQSGYR